MSYTEQMIDSRNPKQDEHGVCMCNYIECTCGKRALDQMYEYSDEDRRMKPIEVPTENPDRVFSKDTGDVCTECVYIEHLAEEYPCNLCNSDGSEFVHFSSQGTEDPVNNPSHYNTGDVECIDGIEAALSPEEFRGYLRGAALKYLWRCTYKGKMTEDLDKAEWYMNKLKETENE